MRRAQAVEFATRHSLGVVTLSTTVVKVAPFSPAATHLIVVVDAFSPRREDMASVVVVVERGGGR